MCPTNSNEQQQFDFLDIITMYSAVLQTLDYEATMQMTSNDDIMEEMRVSIERRLDKIIEQNEKILSVLNGRNN